MQKILEDLMRKRKILKELIFGFAVISVLLASVLSYYYVIVIAQ